jgi:hypothetical protein
MAVRLWILSTSASMFTSAALTHRGRPERAGDAAARGGRAPNLRKPRCSAKEAAFAP